MRGTDKHYYATDEQGRLFRFGDNLTRATWVLDGHGHRRALPSGDPELRARIRRPGINWRTAREVIGHPQLASERPSDAY